MIEVMRFWAEDASNIRCVRESDYDALQSRLNAVEEENDRLRGHLLTVVAGANAGMDESWMCTSYHPLLVRYVHEAERFLALEGKA